MHEFKRIAGQLDLFTRLYAGEVTPCEGTTLPLDKKIYQMMAGTLSEALDTRDSALCDKAIRLIETAQGAVGYAEVEPAFVDKIYRLSHYAHHPVLADYATRLLAQIVDQNDVLARKLAVIADKHEGEGTFFDSANTKARWQEQAYAYPSLMRVFPVEGTRGREPFSDDNTPFSTKDDVRRMERCFRTRRDTLQVSETAIAFKALMESDPCQATPDLLISAVRRALFSSLDTSRIETGFLNGLRMLSLNKGRQVLGKLAAESKGVGAILSAPPWTEEEGGIFSALKLIQKAVDQTPLLADQSLCATLEEISIMCDGAAAQEHPLPRKAQEALASVKSALDFPSRQTRKPRPSGHSLQA